MNRQTNKREKKKQQQQRKLHTRKPQIIYHLVHVELFSRGLHGQSISLTHRITVIKLPKRIAPNVVA